MNSTLLWIIGALLALFAGWVLYRALRSYFKMRGKRLVICPENHTAAAVDLDARHSAKDAIFGVPRLRLSECSRWPEKQACGQECLKQIEEAPEGCLVSRIVADWYKGKNCVLCGKPVDVTEERIGHVPALLNPQNETVYWTEISPEALPEVFQTHSPVCWSCHIAETFRRKHPEMVVNRPPR